MGSSYPKTAAQAAPVAADKKEPSDATKYEKPKILLVDLKSDAFEALVGIGFNVRKGSFGQPYKVPMTSEFKPLISKPHLPNYAEQEIVVVDLQYRAAEQPDGERSRP